MVSSKLPEAGTTIFTVMSQLAQQHNAINLGQGFPDFTMSDSLINLVYKAMQDGGNQYVHTNGLPILRQRLSDKVKHLYSNDIDADQQITITPGGTYAIYTALTCFLQPGDEVIVFEPAYDSYIPNIEVNGAKAVRIALSFPKYRIPWQQVSDAISNRTKAIIINSPHNPTGAVLDENDIAALTLLVQKHNLIVISDEVYEHLIFDSKPHLSILKYPALMERSFVCFSFGKTYHCTGWKMGYCISSPSLMHEYRKVHQFNAFSVNSAMQYGLAEYLADTDAYLSLGKFIQSKRDYFQQLMQSTAFEPIPSYGSYFQCYQYNKISDKPDMEFAKILTQHAGVATIPMSAFYKTGEDNKVLRFCFAKKETTLEQAVERLVDYCRKNYT